MLVFTLPEGIKVLLQKRVLYFGYFQHVGVMEGGQVAGLQPFQKFIENVLLLKEIFDGYLIDRGRFLDGSGVLVHHWTAI